MQLKRKREERKRLEDEERRLIDEFEDEVDRVEKLDRRVADMARQEERFTELMEGVERSSSGSAFEASSEGLTVTAGLGPMYDLSELGDFGVLDPSVWGYPAGTAVGGPDNFRGS